MQWLMLKLCTWTTGHERTCVTTKVTTPTTSLKVGMTHKLTN